MTQGVRVSEGGNIPGGHVFTDGDCEVEIN